MNIHRSLIAVWAIASICTGVLQAQELEEVVVTAERRAENLQEVPNAITALSADTVERSDIHDLTDIATRIPGLTFSPFSPGQNIVALRGASSNDDGAGTDNSVAVFVDDVYLGRVSNINPEMFDIERVEVLRGPQGTLYGKNTIGGAINVVSTRPNTEEFEGKVRVNLGNYQRRDIAGLISGPLGEGWASKASFSYR
ncbi:MAG: TonB-dependent receptor plug domain-containing protein, partial [Rhodospirillaceae bacterium]|nr:TonB-dependent receptor plug domain-containing protein [Rhodospirillaceae bacterium]